jgi:hypothetical protein
LTGWITKTLSPLASAGTWAPREISSALDMTRATRTVILVAEARTREDGHVTLNLRAWEYFHSIARSSATPTIQIP